jgi:CheY-like chemotaxis protein
MNEVEMRKRVLVVDDDDSVVDSLIMALEDNYEIVSVRNGRDALEVLEGKGADAVLLDLMMPVLDGPGFLHECRTRHIQVPILVITAGRNLANRTRALGVNDFIQKPFELAVLEEKLARLTGGPASGG